MNTYIGEGRPKHEKNDCTVIALSYACEISYSTAHSTCKAFGRKDGKGWYIGKHFKKNGGYLKPGEFDNYWVGGKLFKVTAHGRPKMTVKRFAKTNPKGIFIVRVSGHAFCIKNGIVYNQSNERQRVKSYFEVLTVA